MIYKLTSVAHFGAKEFSLEAGDLAGGFIAATTLNKPKIGLQNQVGIGFVLILKLSGLIIRHGELGMRPNTS